MMLSASGTQRQCGVDRRSSLHPALNTSGYAQVERKFDERSRLIAESYYSADGKPTVSEQG